MQSNISDLISRESNFVVTAIENLPSITYIYTSIENLTLSSGGSWNWPGSIEILLIAGIIVTLLIHSFRYIKIVAIVRRSRIHAVLENQIRVKQSDEVTVPFICHNCIVLPTSISLEEKSMAIDHEALHHKFGHHIDNYLFSIFHALFWVNPIIILLKRALSLNHEYQVDKQIISVGIDPIIYKLTLIKFSVGYRSFAIVNRLSNSNIKNRIMMMNKNYKQKGKWRFLLSIPMIGLVLTLMCLSCIQTDSQSESSINQAIDSQADSAVMNLIENHTADLQLAQGNVMNIINISSSEEVIKDAIKDKMIVVLINKNSDILISGEIAHIENAEERIISEYNRIHKEYNPDGNHSISESFDIKIIFQSDVKTNKNDSQNLIGVISSSLVKLRNSYSNLKYNLNFDSLSDTEKANIQELIPFRIYHIIPGKDF